VKDLLRRNADREDYRTEKALDAAELIIVQLTRVADALQRMAAKT
jgi:hypothetical protein